VNLGLQPILPVLADIIVHSPTGVLTYLETQKPFIANGFGKVGSARAATRPDRLTAPRMASITKAAVRLAESGAFDSPSGYPESPSHCPTNSLIMNALPTLDRRARRVERAAESAAAIAVSFQVASESRRSVHPLRVLVR
jgi:hypothetical protein